MAMGRQLHIDEQLILAHRWGEDKAVAMGLGGARMRL